MNSNALFASDPNKIVERIVTGCRSLSAGQISAPRFDAGGIECVTFRSDLNHQSVQAATRRRFDDPRISAFWVSAERPTRDGKLRL